MSKPTYLRLVDSGKDISPCLFVLTSPTFVVDSELRWQAVRLLQDSYFAVAPIDGGWMVLSNILTLCEQGPISGSSLRPVSKWLTDWSAVLETYLHMIADHGTDLVLLARDLWDLKNTSSQPGLLN